MDKETVRAAGLVALGLLGLGAVIAMDVGLSRIKAPSASTSSSTSSQSSAPSASGAVAVALSASEFSISQNGDRKQVVVGVGPTSAVAVAKSSDTSLVDLSSTSDGTGGSPVSVFNGSAITLIAKGLFNGYVYITVYVPGHEADAKRINCFWSQYVTGVSTDNGSILF